MDLGGPTTPSPKPRPQNDSSNGNSPLRPSPLRRSTSSRSGSTPGRPSPNRFIPSSTSIESFRMVTYRRDYNDNKNARRRSSSPRRRRNHSRSVSASPQIGFNAFGAVINGNGLRRTAGGAVSRNADFSPRIRDDNTFTVNAKMIDDDGTLEEELEIHESRLAMALGVDLTGKVLSFNSNDSSPSPEKVNRAIKLFHGMPSIPTEESWNSEGFLDAPGLRDDFYSTLLAYTPVSNLLAVGLGSDVYSWTEKGGAKPFAPWSSSQLTAIAFSSPEGGLDILAIGRVDGVISIWGLGELAPRAEAQHQSAVACVSFKPIQSKRRGLNFPNEWTRCEDLLLGDEMGNIYYYAIEWDPTPGSIACGMTLVRRLNAHKQQICGISWSTDATQVATGGNDNKCILFDIEPSREDDDEKDADEPHRELIVRHRWHHGAAVKAIAFSPWQKSLVATGGGSNDRCIHFYHTYTGASLTSINVSAQVTSLIWSQYRKELAVTFGYANPEHNIRIAVFSWPDCHKIVSIKWGEDMRALYALPYPGGPPETKNKRKSLGDKKYSKENDSDYEGCIVVAASDETIRFHEVWGAGREKIGKNSKLGSEILENLEMLDIETDGLGEIR